MGLCLETGLYLLSYVKTKLTFNVFSPKIFLQVALEREKSVTVKDWQKTAIYK